MSREELAAIEEAEAVTLSWLTDGYDYFEAKVAARARLTKLLFQVIPHRRCGCHFWARFFARGPRAYRYRYLGRYMTPADAQRACEAHFRNIAFERRPRRPRAAQTLIEFLAARGGLDPNDRLIGDVRAAIGRRNKYIRGFGPLIRDNGISLDRAREAAVEAGYLYDLGWISGAPAQTRVTDLLDAVDRELRGAPVYRYDRLPDMTRAEIERMEDEARYHEGRAA